jgi:hypothetical protein
LRIDEMPVMELHSPCDLKLLAVEVKAYMLFPGTDEEKQPHDFFRRSYLSRIRLEQELREAEEEGRENIPIEYVQNLMKYSHVLTEDTLEKKTREACVAAKIFYYLVKLQANGIEPSLNKALSLADYYFRNAVSEAGKRIASSESSTLRAWRDYKPVVHLWAAFLDLFEQGVDPEDAVWSQLTLARGFIELAPTLIDSNGKDVVFAKELLWSVPESFHLPFFQPDVPALKETEKEILKNLPTRSIKRSEAW